MRLNEFDCTGEKPITVFYTDDSNGGGMTFAQDFIPTIKRLYPNRKFGKAFDWCSGAGFIGFSLLSHGLCDSLCLNDLFSPDIYAIKQTIEHPSNKFTDNVSVYLLNDIANLPIKEMFDLVVANPPHYKSYISTGHNWNRIGTDLDWKAHKSFFKSIKSHLNPNAVILLLESIDDSSIKEFEPMINDAGLRIVNIHDSTGGLCFIEIQESPN